MSNKLSSPQQCPRCKNICQWFSGKICHNCYRKYIWKPKKKICPRCNRLKVMKAKGLCPGCYNFTFHLEKTKAYNNTRKHNITIELYKKITKECILCNFNKTVDLHHIDENRKNNSKENMVGLCPNHHKMIHIFKYREEIKDVVEKLMTLKRIRPEAFTETSDNQTNQIYMIPINKELNMAKAC